MNAFFTPKDQQTDMPDIPLLLRQKKITPFYQQVVCVSRNCVCGLEGLIRGVSDVGLISPKALFKAAGERNLTRQLDELCRECVLEGFSDTYREHADKLLFLNIDASVLEKDPRCKRFSRQVAESGIAPGNIVVEISETKVRDSAALRVIIDAYRGAGFLIALDDVGTGFSNLDRIPVTQPDIIKIDVSLVRNIHRDYHRQEVFKSLISLAEQIGALVVAEGVEDEEEAIQALQLGAHMIQGFYFSKPCALGDAEPFSNPRIAPLAARFHTHMGLRICQDTERRAELVRIAQEASASLKDCELCRDALLRIVNAHDVIECAYVLDETGMQCGDAVFREARHAARSNLKVCSMGAGTDHSMKRYFYRLMSGNMEGYVTEPYVSTVTGNMCVTVSMPFLCSSGSRCVFCAEFKTAFRP